MDTHVSGKMQSHQQSGVGALIHSLLIVGNKIIRIIDHVPTKHSPLVPGQSFFQAALWPGETWPKGMS